VQILFWLMVAVCVILAPIQFALGVAGMNRTEGLMLMLTAPLILIFGPLFARIYAELVIVIFRINETLTDIRSELRKKNQP
jgi:hypothetical protein